jgi:hypothetical protein
MGHELSGKVAQREQVIKLVQQQLLGNDLVGVTVVGTTAISVGEFQHLSHTQNEPNLRLLPVAVRGDAEQQNAVVGGYLPAMASWEEVQATLQHLLTAPLESLVVDHGH